MKKQTRLNPVIVKKIGYLDSIPYHFWALCNDGNVWFYTVSYRANCGNYDDFMQCVKEGLYRIIRYDNQ